MLLSLCLAVSISLFEVSCKQAPVTPAQPISVDVPVFNPDSAYFYTERQVAFGPRVPNTAAHKACGHYIANELRRFGAEVVEQETTLRLKDNSPIEIKNIIGSFNPEVTTRVLLCAHWDSRPFADMEHNSEDRLKPIDGANDGAGATAILLEIARQIGLENTSIGVDIVLFDAEDWGQPHFEIQGRHYGDWCMGSAYWAQHPHKAGYTAKYGILLDMVSAPDAKFYKEPFSVQNAPHIVRKVWDAAKTLGFGDYFPNQNGGGIEDDHLQVIKYRKIPCIDIIHYVPDNYASGFGDYWHTHNDNMGNVDKATINAVGQTLMYIIYNEK